MNRKKLVFWEDEHFLDKLTAVLASDVTALKQCSGLLGSNDFKPLQGQKWGSQRWVVAERCLEHFKRHGEPIGKLLRADVLEYSHSLSLGEHQIAELLAYVKHLKTIPLSGPSAVTDKIVRYKEGRLRASVLEEMVQLHAAGELDPAKWNEMSRKALTQCQQDSAKPISGAELYNAEYPTQQFVVNPMLPVGLGMLTARPKMGKTFLGLQLSIALVRGDTAFLGEKLKMSGRVLYYALEDTPRRLTNRLRTLAPQASADTLERLEKNLVVRFDWQGEDALRAELQRQKYVLVVIDTLLKTQQQSPRKSGDIVGEDYRTTAKFSTISQESGVAILLIHHARKPKSGESNDDMRDVAIGTTGLTAPLDTIWNLSRTNEGAIRKLEVTGRDVEEQTLKIEFTILRGWLKVANGVAAEVGGPLKRQILQLLSDAGEMTAKAITGALETLGESPSLNSVQVTLSKLREDDKVVNTKGKWRLLCE